MVNLKAYIQILRPKQWVKNLLVLAAPFAAGSLLSNNNLLKSTVAVISFVFMSASVYVINDLNDAASDREHPLKKDRPIAKGLINPRSGIALAAALFIDFDQL